MHKRIPSTQGTGGPYVLALSNDDEHMAQLLDFSALIEEKNGITTAVRVLQARGYRAVELKADAEKDLARIIFEKESSAVLKPLRPSCRNEWFGNFS